MKRAARRSTRKRKQKRLAHMVIASVEDFDRWRWLYGHDEQSFQREKEKVAIRERRDHRRVLTASHKFNNRESDYTGYRTVVKDRDAYCDLKNQAECAGALRFRCPRRTGKDLW